MSTIQNALSALLWVAAVSCPALPAAESTPPAAEKKNLQMLKMDDAKSKDWLNRWEKNIVGDAQNRYCDKEMGEIWTIHPFLNGFYYGYMTTKDTKWVDMLVDWTDSFIKRGVKEPDGYIGWPKVEAAGTDVDKLNAFNADSLVSEAMIWRPVLLMSGEILKTPALKAKYGAKADSYLKLSEQMFEKYDKRGSWRDAKDGGCMSMDLLPFGIDTKTGKWTEGYETRNAPGNGFSHPDNKANETARWLLALFDVTHKPLYKDRAEKWFRLLKSRLKPKDDNTYAIWNYWEPAGAWDYKPDGSPKHWVGVHPNAGYYEMDLRGIVDAYEHGLVFTKEDIARLIATGLAEKRYWQALVPYNETIQKQFEDSLKPESWGGLEAAPWYLALQVRLREQAGGGR